MCFIADSGATEHIVDSNLYLTNFERLENRVIMSANKNELADIKINGKRDLIFQSKNKTINLLNVISTKDVSENLLSLRKLADAGLSNHLDNKNLRVYEKENNKTVLEGEYDIYCCRATVVSDDEIPEQPRKFVENKKLSGSEGALEKQEFNNSAIGREKSRNHVNESSLNNRKDEKMIEKLEETKSDPLEQLQLDDITTIQNLESIHTMNLSEKSRKSSEKINEAMLWHMRLGHASLDYLKRMQKTNKNLEKVKFGDEILECEVCTMAKMQKLPFREMRKRASRSLQLIHTDTMGPIKPTSHPGRNIFITVYVDDFSRYARAYSNKTKDESGESLEKFLI